MRNSRLALPLVLALLVPVVRCRADVVINEIFYNGPDDWDGVQWVELYNTGNSPVDLGGWELDEGKLFTFPAGTSIARDGFVVVALNPDEFKKAYDAEAIGPFKRPLKRGGERIKLRTGPLSASHDVARYKDESPWPLSADGYSASLERICPTASGDEAENWAGSPLPDTPRPAGTPGIPNSCLSKVLPPVISLAKGPAVVAPGESLQVTAEAKGGDGVREMTLLYRLVTPDGEAKEVAVAMKKDEAGKYAAEVPPQKADTLVRYRVKAVGETGATRFSPAENDLRPARSAYVHGSWEKAPIALGLLMLGGVDRQAAGDRPDMRPGFGGPGGFRGPPGGRRGGGGFRGGPFFGGDDVDTPRPPRGASTFVHVDPETGKAEAFDFVNAPQRGRRPGNKVFFHKDRPLNGMHAVSMIFEGNELSLLSEALSYDLYRRAGNAAPLTEFVRLSVDGLPQGYHLAVERPTKAFLRRNEVDDDGNLYKARWFGQGVVGQHVKKTHTNGGHDDLLALIDKLDETRDNPDARWEVIRNNFDVEQVATHFAVNMVLSHWDGFFNNFYTYHDTKRGRWQMYPWDHDQAWGIMGWGGGGGGGGGGRPLVDIPLTFGMEGDVPPGGGGGRGGRGGFGGPFGGGPGWWRPPGYFSGPLLANPQFRKVFLSRLRTILDEVYTEKQYVPVIDELVRRLREDASLRAEARGQDASDGPRYLAASAEFLKTHLRQRRAYLLRQPEIKSAGKK